MTDWGEDVKEYRRPPMGHWYMQFTGIGTDKDGSPAFRQTDKGPRFGLQLVGSDGASVMDWTTFNATTAWRVKIINKALGLPSTHLKSVLQARDLEITANDFPHDLVEALVKTWTGKKAWVAIDAEGNVVTWMTSEPTIKGATTVTSKGGRKPDTGEAGSPSSTSGTRVF